ncbi:MAG: S1 RNA-binding domain-containing protein [Candidatus Goldiibacteriota bacterium]
MKNSDFDFSNIREGSIVKGTVIRKTEGDIYVDIEYKAEGIIPSEETRRYKSYDEINDGDVIDVLIKRVEGKDGMVVLSKIIADKKRIFSAVKKAYKDGGAVSGKIVKKVKGGFIVDFGANVTSFLPMSHAKLLEGEPEGMEIPLKVIQLDEEKRNVVVSHKEYVSQKEKIEKEKRLRVFPLNEKTEAEIKSVSEAGINIVKDGCEGFIPKNEIAWKLSGDIPEEFSAGKKIQVLPVELPGKGAILSMKRIMPNPYKSFFQEHKQGDVIKVKIRDYKDDGACVCVNDEIDGFIHISEISYLRRIKNIPQILKKDEEIEARIIKADDEENMVYLSIKRLEEDPWPDLEQRYPVGARAVGVIGEIKEGEGVSVELEENLDAFVKAGDISWFGFNSISEAVRPGDKKEFKILGIDKDRNRIMLGLKQLTASPWSGFAAKYKEGSAMDVKVVDICDACVICEVVPGVAGRIPIKNKNRIKTKSGDIINARITKIDREAGKVYLASKDIEITEEKKQLDEYMKKHEHTFKMNDLINFGGEDNEEKK